MNRRLLSSAFAGIVGLAATMLATAQSNNNAPVPAAQQSASGAKAGAVRKAQQSKAAQQPPAVGMANRPTQSQQSQSPQGPSQQGQQPVSRQEKASRISSKVLKSTQDAASAAASNVK
ncbi:hypothetical protein [Piscinibacter terrae]|uniref:Uncharacterized protein n=1 Tax=Piscinibacter terrae TaxID=2496871 RepID=A0A3N7HQG5_9BURK|nr:hypothetical protein [Albitalea terrae]RQP24450.1 hypothetical protein DZC73_14275 [Albitalea terrae]